MRFDEALLFPYAGTSFKIKSCGTLDPGVRCGYCEGDGVLAVVISKLFESADEDR